MILDATAGNRLMWKAKTHPSIIYIDIEDELEFSPDILCDNTNTPFREGFFNLIFYDPPYDYGVKKNSRIMTTLQRE